MTEQEIQRRESLSKLREMGIDPYPADMFDVTANAREIIANYQEEILVVQQLHLHHHYLI